MKYQKRLHWDRHRPEFLKLGFIFALAITFMAFNYTSNPPIIEPFDDEPLSEQMMIIPPRTEQKKKVVPPPLPPPNPKNVVEIEPTTEPIIEFEQVEEIEQDVKTVEDEYANNAPTEIAPIVEPIEEKENVEEDLILVFAERMPIYGSCNADSEESEKRDCTNQNLINHIYKNVKYPALAKESDVQGTVVASFIVNKFGQVEDVQILRDIGLGCGDEVKRVINKLDKFLPGKQNGRPVSVIYRIPIKFSLQ